jgi:hypothetical protein
MNIPVEVSGVVEKHLLVNESVLRMVIEFAAELDHHLLPTMHGKASRCLTPLPCRSTELRQTTKVWRSV